MGITSFFLTSIQEVPAREGEIVYQNKCKIWGDVCFKELRYWLNGREFIYNSKEFIPKQTEFYNTTIQKINSLIKAIILFLPGLVLNCIAYSDSLIKWKFNRLKLYQETEKATIKIEPSKYLISKIVQYNNCLSGGSELNAMPDSIITEHILPCLDFQFLHLFAQSCLRYYQLANKEILRQEKEKYIPFTSILKDKLFQVPFVIAKGALLDLIELTQSDLTTWDTPDRDEIQFLKLIAHIRSPFPGKEHLEMGKRAICRIKDQDHLWIIFRLVIRPSPDIKSEAIIPFVKVKGKWHCVKNDLPGYLSLPFTTFNHDKSESSRALNILKKLLNKEPIGLFPDNLNDPLNLDSSTLISQLQEGPSVHSNGTSMVELWSEEN